MSTRERIMCWKMSVGTPGWQAHVIRHRHAIHDHGGEWWLGTEMKCLWGLRLPEVTVLQCKQERVGCHLRFAGRSRSRGPPLLVPIAPARHKRTAKMWQWRGPPRRTGREREAQAEGRLVRKSAPLLTRPMKHPTQWVGHSGACGQGVPTELRDAHPVSQTESGPRGHSVGCAERGAQSTSCCRLVSSVAWMCRSQGKMPHPSDNSARSSSSSSSVSSSVRTSPPWSSMLKSPSCGAMCS